MRSGDAVAGLEALVRGHLSAASVPMGQALAVNLHALRGAEPRLGAARYERLVAGIIEQGMSSGQIRTVPVRPAVKLVIGAMNGVSQWFKPDGKLPLEDVVTGVVGVLLTGVERDPGLRGGPGVP